MEGYDVACVPPRLSSTPAKIEGLRDEQTMQPKPNQSSQDQINHPQSSASRLRKNKGGRETEKCTSYSEENNATQTHAP
jgi:hypothetical protein